MALAFLTIGCSTDEGARPEPITAQPGQGQQAPQSTAPPAPDRYITGFVFEDRNANGTFDAGDVRIARQQVVLSDPSAAGATATAITGPDGAFRFENLEPGDYRVTVQVPETFSRANDSSFVLAVPEDGSPAEVQFGLVPGAN